MKKFFLYIFYFIAVSFSFSQPINDYKYDFNWITGQDSTNEPKFNLTDDCMHFNFNSDTLLITKESGLANFYNTSASISDRNGNLLFFTNGCHVFNKNYQIMENGEYINAPEDIENHCDGIYNTGYWLPQGALILPRFENDSIYDLLTLQYILKPNFDLIMQYLHHSIINIKANNGLGSIVEKNNVIIDDSLSCLLTAIKKENSNDWWVITKKEKTTKYYILDFNKDGYSSMHSQFIGIYDKENDISGNGSSFSPDGTKYAHYEPRQGLFLYNFDRENGILSNFQLINVVGMKMDTLQDGYISFSPNSKFIYLSTGDKLWQIDLQVPNPEKDGIELIAEIDYKPNPHTIFYTTFGIPTRGPDCRIYFGMFGAQEWFTVINNPNEKGKACNVFSAKTLLPMWQWPAFPNMINYRLDTGEPLCDSNKVVLTASNFITFQMNGPLNVYPNPGKDVITLSGFEHMNGDLEFVNMQEEIVLNSVVKKDINVHQVDTSDLERGFYVIRFIDIHGKVKICKWIKF